MRNEEIEEARVHLLHQTKDLPFVKMPIYLVQTLFPAATPDASQEHVRAFCHEHSLDYDYDFSGEFVIFTAIKNTF